MKDSEEMRAERVVAAGRTPLYQRLVFWAAALLCVALVVFIRTRLLEIPLERDEGEYAYMGQLILEGTMPYTEAYNMKFPGAYFVYALLFLFFEQSAAGIHGALLLTSLLSAFLLFLLGRKLGGSRVGAVAGVAYLVLSASPSVQGLWANTEHFVVPAMLAGMLCTLAATDNPRRTRFFLGGFFTGLSVLMKQHAIFFALLGGLLVLQYLVRTRRGGEAGGIAGPLFFAAGVAVPLAAVLLILVLSGAFGTFWFWTIAYSSQYATLMTPSEGAANFLRSASPVARAHAPMLVLALLGIFAAVRRRHEAGNLFPHFFLLSSLLALSAGFYFRPHYFVLTLPALALLCGIGADALLGAPGEGKVRRPLFLLVLLGALAFPFLSQRQTFFSLSPEEVAREQYGANPFVESREIARYLAEHTGEEDRIAILGSEPQILFYAKRKPATGYLYMYGLMEAQPYALKMQRECIAEIEAARPPYIVVVSVPTSWLRREDSETAIFSWMASYVGRHYERVAVVDLVSPTFSRYLWGEESRGYRPLSPRHVTIYRRRG